MKEMGRRLGLMSVIGKLTFILLGLLLLGLPCRGMDYSSKLNVHQFTIADGLSNGNITSLYQDSRGYVWIGTADGLNRYDGYKFDVFRHNPMDSTTIVGNSIQAIVETSDGNIWIGTKNSGIAIWNRTDGSFNNINTNSEPFKEIKEAGVFGMRVINGDVWIKTRNFVFRIDEKLASYDVYGHYSSVFKTGSGACYPIVEDGESLWIGSKDGLHHFDTDSKTFTKIALRTENSKDELSDVLAINDSVLMVSTLDGVMRYDTKNETIMSSSLSGGQSVNEQMLCMLQDGDNILLGTTDGIKIAHPPFFHFSTFDHFGISDADIKNVSVLMVDNGGILWAGTKQDGLFKVDRKPHKFSLISREEPELALESYDFSAVYVDDENQMWLGTSNKGIYRIDRSSGRMRHFNILPVYTSENDPAILSILKDSKGKVWIGSSYGIYVIENDYSNVREFDYSNSPEFKTLLASNRINDIIEDQLGNIWFATQFGLYRYNGKTLSSYFSDNEKEASLCHDEINALYEDSDGWIWIGTNNGVNVFNHTEANFTRIQNQFDGNAELSHNIVLSFSEDLDKRIIIGTQSGLSYYDKKIYKTGFWKDNPALATNKIYAIEVDRYNRIWLSSSDGISYLLPDGSYFRFSEKDGVPEHSFNIGSSFNHDSSTLFFGGDKGLSIIQADSLSQNLHLPQVIITDLTIKRKGKLSKDYKGDVRDVNIRYSRNLLIHVEFSGMEYTNPKLNSYMVFLEGYDDSWRKITNDNYVDFSNLSPGSYVLKIKGANSDLVWNNEPTELVIEVVPPLWMSNYAYAFYLILGFFLIQTLINYRIRNYRRAYKALQEKAHDKKKIEAQKETLSNINQSLTDSISYAKRIQEAMIPSEEMVQSIFPESFVYFRPKDIVSGDFYWTFQRDNKVFMAAVDCTGHGVPGAFMSIIGFDLIKNIVEIRGIECPANILNVLNKEVVATFNKNGAKGINSKLNVNDGMDVSLIVYDRSKGLIEFAGAMNPLYIIHDNEINNYKGNRFPIGYMSADSTSLFTKQEIKVERGDIVYMFSDGYADQFGGPEGKKFKYRRFRHLLLNIHKLPVLDQKAILHQKMEEWMGNEHEQIDDILLLGLKL
ncbi:ligand-binding sensor domain-containing protein [Carboxylicivirga sp. N1Y90]|uniref:ligand-binding sensor domain-containing protein n=1 Tax=Carboxylicivirga fragile TaxID=3417571 RepID=UPI003D325F53|nr:SpoIIE family protein phosphatase [Marinilabiliaceae bacterium N1Y90]